MNLRHALVALLFASPFLNAPAPSRADLITYHFSAIVTSAVNWDNSVQAGSVFSGTYTIDTQTGSAGALSSLYDSPPNANGFQNLTIGSNVFGPGTVYDSHAGFRHGFEGTHTDTMGLDGGFTPQSTAFGDQAFARISGSGMNILTSGAPPTSVAALNAFHPTLGFEQGHGNVTSEFFSMPNPDRTLAADITFTSVQVAPVPEVGSLLMFALGLSLCGAHALRRRSS